MKYYLGAYHLLKLKPLDFGKHKGQKVLTGSRCLNESYLLFANSQKNIKFNIKKEKQDIYFQFDKFQLSQCFNNLIKNAVEAVEKIPNPSIFINDGHILLKRLNSSPLI